MSTAGGIHLLLDDVKDDHWHPWVRHSTWLDLQTGRVIRINLCKQELLDQGWTQLEDVVVW
jgi:hypothetical protein